MHFNSCLPLQWPTKFIINIYRYLCGYLCYSPSTNGKDKNRITPGSKVAQKPIKYVTSGFAGPNKNRFKAANNPAAALFIRVGFQKTNALIMGRSRPNKCTPSFWTNINWLTVIGPSKKLKPTRQHGKKKEIIKRIPNNLVIKKNLIILSVFCILQFITYFVVQKRWLAQKIPRWLIGGDRNVWVLESVGFG